MCENEMRYNLKIWPPFTKIKKKILYTLLRCMEEQKNCSTLIIIIIIIIIITF